MKQAITHRVNPADITDDVDPFGADSDFETEEELRSEFQAAGSSNIGALLHDVWKWILSALFISALYLIGTRVFGSIDPAATASVSKGAVQEAVDVVKDAKSEVSQKLEDHVDVMKSAKETVRSAIPDTPTDTTEEVKGVATSFYQSIVNSFRRFMERNRRGMSAIKPASRSQGRRTYRVLSNDNGKTAKIKARGQQQRKHLEASAKRMKDRVTKDVEQAVKSGREKFQKLKSEPEKVEDVDGLERF